MRKLLLSALFMVLAFCFVAKAAPTPTERLTSTIDEVLAVLKNPDYKDSVKRIPLRAQLEKKIHEGFDFAEFSSRTVGRNWQAFSADQKERFQEAFANLLMVTYLDKIQGYNGEQVEYLKEVLSQKGDRAEVQTTVALSDGKKVPVSYRMLLKNDTWSVYDVLIENVSLVKNYRSQFQDVLARGTAEQLIDRVNTRAQELQAQAAVN